MVKSGRTAHFPPPADPCQDVIFRGRARLTALLRSTAVRAGRKGNDWEPYRLGGSVSDRWIVRELAGSTGGVGRLQWPLVLALQPRASTRLLVRRRSHLSVAGSHGRRGRLHATARDVRGDAGGADVPRPGAAPLLRRARLSERRVRSRRSAQ